MFDQSLTYKTLEDIALSADVRVFGRYKDIMRNVIMSPEDYDREALKEKLRKGKVSKKMIMLFDNTRNKSYLDIYTLRVVIAGPVELSLMLELWDMAEMYLDEGYTLRDYMFIATSYIFRGESYPEMIKEGRYNGHWTYEKTGAALILCNRRIPDGIFRNIMEKMDTDFDMSVRHGRFLDPHIYLNGIQRCNKLMEKEWSDKYITEKAMVSLLYAYWYTYADDKSVEPDPELGEFGENEKPAVLEMANILRKRFVKRIRRSHRITGDTEVFWRVCMEQAERDCAGEDITLSDRLPVLENFLTMWMEAIYHG
ncbi:MAG: hypothetical protein K6A90_00200 [Lachnospiraceae bacterium]|nr:hypothetical protein [Lachnospiraceae bacterium]